MNEEQRLAFLQSQIACALITMEGMKAENEKSRCDCGYPVYGETDFSDLIDNYKLGYNDVIGRINGD